VGASEEQRGVSEEEKGVSEHSLEMRERVVGGTMRTPSREGEGFGGDSGWDALEATFAGEDRQVTPQEHIIELILSHHCETIVTSR
jgi:hypothetical protein